MTRYTCEVTVRRVDDGEVEHIFMSSRPFEASDDESAMDVVEFLIQGWLEQSNEALRYVLEHGCDEEEKDA